jgi:hypothetical protein
MAHGFSYLWRSVKYEDVYLRDYEYGRELQTGLATYLDFSNRARFHQSQGYQTPDEIYFATPVDAPLPLSWHPPISDLCDVVRSSGTLQAASAFARSIVSRYG